MKSQAQRDAQINAMEAARGAAAKRAQAKEAAERIARERAEAAANQPVIWGNWDYVLGHTHEVRATNDGTYAEIRPLRL